MHASIARTDVWGWNKEKKRSIFNVVLFDQCGRELIQNQSNAGSYLVANPGRCCMECSGCCTKERCDGISTNLMSVRLSVCSYGPSIRRWVQMGR